MLREAFTAAGSSSSKSGEPSVPVLASTKAFESLVRAKQALFSLSLSLSLSLFLFLFLYKYKKRQAEQAAVVAETTEKLEELQGD